MKTQTDISILKETLGLLQQNYRQTGLKVVQEKLSSYLDIFNPMSTFHFYQILPNPLSPKVLHKSHPHISCNLIVLHDRKVLLIASPEELMYLFQFSKTNYSTPQ